VKEFKVYDNAGQKVGTDHYKKLSAQTKKLAQARKDGVL
jgi:hypothetical protein